MKILCYRRQNTCLGGVCMSKKEFSHKRIGTVVLSMMVFIITATAGFVSVLAETGRPDDVAAQKASEVKDTKPVSPLNEADLVREQTSKRQKFVKQFHLSDGTFLAATYSVPVHYKKSKNGAWKEIDTTLKKTADKKYYKTKSTSLQIRASVNAASKSLVSLKRGGDSLAWKPVIRKKSKILKKIKAVVKNPKKIEKTDICNENNVTYKNIQKNVSFSYQIQPEKVTETITVKKKQKKRSFAFQIRCGKMKVKVKKGRIYFKTKKGKTRYTRLKTIVTDAKGVSTTKVKVTYNRKKKELTITPDQSWWKNKKRKFPMKLRTSTVTDQQERDVRIGAAYAGAPTENYTYDSSLLLQSGKCTSFIQMTTLAELGQANVKILHADLHLQNQAALMMGAGRTFDIGIHKVTEKWKPKKVTYNNRPVYKEIPDSTASIQKKGRYKADVTDTVKSWYQGEENYGVALTAENTNGIYKAKLDKYPYFTVRYEVVGFDGAVELEEDRALKRDVMRAGQENYYYFDPEPGVAYDLFATSTLDTQATLYDAKKSRLAYDDNSGVNGNFAFVRGYDGRRYLKVSTKGKGTGSYTLTLKRRFARPVVTGKAGQDSYVISWNKIRHAKSYIVTIYDEEGKAGETTVSGISYEYVYTDATAGKTLAFTVKPVESSEIYGEASRKIYNTNSASEWEYGTPMNTMRKNFSSVECDEKIYVLGGEKEDGPLTGMEVYDTKKETWTRLADYPGNPTGICHAAMAADDHMIYVCGGQTDSSSRAKILSDVYAYDTKSGQWSKKKSMSDKRTGLSAVTYRGKIYLFARIGTTERVDIYDPSEDSWEEHLFAGTSNIVQAFAVDDRILVLREERADGSDLRNMMYFEEYLPDKTVFDKAGEKCPFTGADRYTSGAVSGGRIYINKEKETDQVIYYDAYTDQWGKVPVMNLKKQQSELQAVGGTLYSMGGKAGRFGTLDVLEKYDLDKNIITKKMKVESGEAYEVQIDAGNCREDTDYAVILRTDPGMVSMERASSFMKKKEIQKGKSGVRLIYYAPDSGVIVFRLYGTMEAGQTREACQSIPLEGVKDGVATVEMQVEEV